MAEIILDDNLEFLKESYSLLEEALDELLTDSDLISSSPVNNIFNGILMKIDYIRKNYQLTEEDREELKDLENNTVGKVFDLIKSSFPGAYENIQTTLSQDVPTRFIAETVYTNIYLNRRELLLNYLVETVLENKLVFVKQYKNSDSKKDIEYQALRAELSISNSDYYVLLLNYDQIANDLLNNENGSITDILNCSDLTEETSELLSEVFSGNEQESFAAITANLEDSMFYREFINYFKNILFNRIKNTK